MEPEKLAGTLWIYLLASKSLCDLRMLGFEL